MVKTVESPEERVEIINRNIASLNKKMKGEEGWRKYNYHFEKLKKARAKILLEAQMPQNSYSMK